MKVQQIPLSKIDPPKNPHRKTLHGPEFDELKNSLAERGLINPIVVRRHPERQGRYEIIAGHRRFEAAKQLGWKTIDARIVEADEIETEAIRLIENAVRKDLAEDEKVRAILELLDMTNGKVTEVARLTGLSKGRISQIAKLARAPGYLWQELEEGRISVDVAIELMKIDDDATRFEFTKHARSGASRDTVRQWRQTWEAEKLAAETDTTAHDVIEITEQEVIINRRCPICEEMKRREEFRFWEICADCILDLNEIVAALKAGYRLVPPEENTNPNRSPTIDRSTNPNQINF